MDAINLYVYDEKNSHSHQVIDDLARRGFSVRVLETDELLSTITKTTPEAVLMNFSNNPGVEHLSLVQEIHSLDEHLPVFIMVPQSDVMTAVNFMKAGAQDYLIWPAAMDHVDACIRRACHVYNLTKKIFQAERKAANKGDFLGIVGQSAKMQENFKMISTVAKSNATILIQGESGTGKELVAKAIHALSERPKNKFVDLNCGAIPRELLENELFGHERGSFTGADRRYIGSFERANAGTIFLDEISEMDPSLQVKILRVFQ